MGLTQADAAIHGDRVVFDLRQGDVHRQLIVRVLAPNGTRAEDAARLAGGLEYSVGNAVTPMARMQLGRISRRGSGQEAIVGL